MTDAKIIYEALVQQINLDCERRDYSGSLELCKSYGMLGGGKPYGAGGEHFIYEISTANGDKVEFDFKWYDKSKTFSIQPDVHRFSVSFRSREGKFLSHSNSYEA